MDTIFDIFLLYCSQLFTTILTTFVGLDKNFPKRGPYARYPLQAAFRPPDRRPSAPLVRTAFLAAALRAALPLLRADCRACLDKAACDAAEWPSRFNAALTARERLADVFFLVREWPLATSRFAFSRVASEVLPFFGGGRSTPARRAFDKPMAIACFVEAAPCLPSRMWSISSFTNSPA